MKKHFWRRTLAAWLCAGLCAGPAGCAPQSGPSDGRPPAPVPVGTKTPGAAAYARSGGYELWADGDTGEIRITDRTGAPLWSTHAALGEGVYDIAGEDRRYATLLVYATDRYNNANMASSYTHSVQQGGLTLEAISDGVRLYFDFPGETEQYTIPVEFTLKEGRLSAEILFDHICTYGDVQINTIDLMPYFGAALKEDEGYLLVPDGSGALIRFRETDKEAEVYSQPVYGQDPALTAGRQLDTFQDVRLPVYGVSRNGRGFVAYARQGACEASVNAGQPGKVSNFSHIHFSFTYTQRDSYTLADRDQNAQTVYVNAEISSKSNPAVTWLFLEERADYVGMAQALREYLMETEGYTRTGTKDPALFLEVFGGAMEQKNLLGIPYETLETATTFADVEEMLSRLRARIFPEIYVLLYGFQKKGMYHNADSWGFDAAFGGSKGFQSLCQYAAGQRATVLPALEFQAQYGGGRGGAARRISGDYITQGLRLPHTGERDEDASWYLLSPAKAARRAADFLKGYEPVPGAGLFFPDYGCTVYADYHKDAPLVRSEALEQITQTLAAAGHIAVGGGGNLYAAAHASAVVQAPQAASGYRVETESVPFYALLMHGLNTFAGSPVNEAGDPQESFLRCVSVGYSLNFRLTAESPYCLRKTDLNVLVGTQFSAWEEDIAAMCGRLPELAGLNDQFITDYHKEGTLSVTLYEGGTRVYVNCGTEVVTADGHTIPARDFLCVGM